MKKMLKVKPIMLATLVAALVAIAAILEIWLDYRNTETKSYETAADITRVVERQVRDTVTYVDQTLNAVSALLLDAGGIAGIQQPANWEIFRSYCTTLIGCNAIVVIDPTGKVQVQSRSIHAQIFDVSDRAYFIQARDSRKRFIDAAVLSRLPGSLILFSISKPVFDATGKLVAVVAVGMETSQLTSFYSLFGFSLAPAISVFKSDGGIVARHPGMGEYVGKSNAQSQIFTTYLPKAPYGTYESISRLDGKKRLAAYRSLPDLDLVIFSGIEMSAAFADWKIRTLRLVTIVSGLLALIWGALFAAYRAVAEQAVLRQENKNLDALASRDALTGIGNRRLFERMLKRDWNKHARSGTPLSIALIDVDYFKPFNDHYGHPAGDDCLRLIAQALQDSLQREGDLVARYGGEEFIALLDCGSEGARHMADRMRRNVEALGKPHAFSKASSVVTISIGVATIENTRSQNFAELVAVADKALYEAKARGRNQVCFSKAGLQVHA
jgi:diguanylate cyclase (GGDEF)-like protein